MELVLKSTFPTFFFHHTVASKMLLFWYSCYGLLVPGTNNPWIFLRNNWSQNNLSQLHLTYYQLNGHVLFLKLVFHLLSRTRCFLFLLILSGTQGPLLLPSLTCSWWSTSGLVDLHVIPMLTMPNYVSSSDHSLELSTSISKGQMNISTLIKHRHLKSIMSKNELLILFTSNLLFP